MLKWRDIEDFMGLDKAVIANQAMVDAEIGDIDMVAIMDIAVELSPPRTRRYLDNACSRQRKTIQYQEAKNAVSDIMMVVLSFVLHDRLIGKYDKGDLRCIEDQLTQCLPEKPGSGVISVHEVYDHCGTLKLMDAKGAARRLVADKIKKIKRR